MADFSIYHNACIYKVVGVGNTSAMGEKFGNNVNNTGVGQ